VAVVSLAAAQAFAMPSYFYGWGSPSRGPMATMGGVNGHMNGNACNMMNGQGMMNGQSMNYQECQEHMGVDGSQMMNVQHQQQSQQYMGSNHSMTPEECQAIHE